MQNKEFADFFFRFCTWGGLDAVWRQLRMQQASGRRDQGPSARALSEVRAARPVQNASVALLLQGCFEVVKPTGALCAAGFKHPSPLRLHEA